MEGIAGLVEVLDEVDEPAAILERDLLDGVLALVAQPDLQALVEERHLPEPRGDRLVVERGRLLEHVR